MSDKPNALTPNTSLTHSDSSLTHNWFERGELPPVGVECEYRYRHQQNSVWLAGKIMYIGTDLFIAFDGHEERAHFVENAKFRPIRTEREKAIEAATKLYDEKKCFSAESFAGELYDAGLLRLPEGK